MKPANVELLSGRDIGVSGSYYKPTEKELFQDYTKAIHLLTVNEDTKKLERQFIELEEKSKDNEYIISSKLQEKDEQIASLRSEMRSMREIVNKIISST
jgi:phage anti-repressor protein